MLIFDLILATRRSNLTGVERYGVRLFESVREIVPDAKAFVYKSDAFTGTEGLIEVPDVFASWLCLPRLIRKRQLDPSSVVFPTAPASPLFRLNRTPLCRIMHDAFPWTRGDKMTIQGRVLFKDVEGLMISRYTQLLGTTQLVAQELVSHVGRPDIGWCGNAPGLDVWNIAPRPVGGLPSRFMLAVGTVEPRKDYRRLIRLAEAGGSDALPIVIVGRPGWGEIAKDLAAAVAQFPERIVWLQDLTDDGALVWLYQNAAGFISLSLAEGFNMPLVEAAMFGRPIFCSDLPIHREVAPPWAQFIAPDDQPDHLWQNIVHTMQAPDAIDVDTYRRRYSWNMVASRLLKIIGPAH